MVHPVRICRLQTDHNCREKEQRKGLIPIDFFCLSCLPPHWSGLEWGVVGGRSCALLEVGGAGWREKEGQEGRCTYLPRSRFHTVQSMSETRSFLSTFVPQLVYPHKQSSELHMSQVHLPSGLYTMSTEMYYAYEGMYYAPPPSSHHTTPHIQYAQVLAYIRTHTRVTTFGYSSKTPLLLDYCDHVHR